MWRMFSILTCHMKTPWQGEKFQDTCNENSRWKGVLGRKKGLDSTGGSGRCGTVQRQGGQTVENPQMAVVLKKDLWTWSNCLFCVCDKSIFLYASYKIFNLLYIARWFTYINGILFLELEQDKVILMILSSMNKGWRNDTIQRKNKVVFDIQLVDRNFTKMEIIKLGM